MKRGGTILGAGARSCALLALPAACLDWNGAFKPGLTLRKAIALAGGFTERASKSKLSVIRDADADRTPQQASLETRIMPGDLITIEQSFF